MPIWYCTLIEQYECKKIGHEHDDCGQGTYWEMWLIGGNVANNLLISYQGFVNRRRRDAFV